MGLQGNCQVKLSFRVRVLRAPRNDRKCIVDCHGVFEVYREAEKEGGDFYDCNEIRFENKQKQNQIKGKERESNMER